MSAKSTEPKARWRYFADRLKHNPRALHIADRLGRGRGHLRYLDCLGRIPAAPLRPDLSDWNSREVSVVWLGHASLLIRMGGMTILTDPVFSPRVGIGLGVMTAGPRRLVALPLPEKSLPTPDLILISHAHFDHLDRPTLARLPKSAQLITSEHNSDLLRDLAYKKITELKLGESAAAGGDTLADVLKITAIPVKHWGARVFHDAHRGACAFLMETPTFRLLYGADTAHHELWKSLPPIDLAAIGIGAYNPWVANHATPEQAADMAAHCQAKLIVPIHHSTFKLSHEPLAEPLHRLQQIVPAEKLALTQIGGQWTKTISG